jgi:hypothetical protein
MDRRKYWWNKKTNGRYDEWKKKDIEGRTNVSQVLFPITVEGGPRK